MKPQYRVVGGGISPSNDVAVPQADNLHTILCSSPLRQAIVTEGRTQAAVPSHLGRMPGQSDRPTQQEPRSRGCPRAQKQFLPFAQLPSWQPAAAKKQLKRLILKTLQCPKSLFTPVNTSKTLGRADGAFCAAPALFLPSLRTGGAA